MLAWRRGLGAGVAGSVVAFNNSVVLALVERAIYSVDAPPAHRTSAHRAERT